MWDTCYENGDEFLGDDADVEAAARWDGEPGKLTAALLGAGGEGHYGFIEEMPDRLGRYIVHDLWHHAPEYVRKRRKREFERRSKTDPLAPDGVRCPGTVQSVTGQRTPSPDCLTEVGDTPAPAPAPAPSKTISSKDNAFDQVLERVWNYYLEVMKKNPKMYRFTDKRRSMGRTRLAECCRMAAEPKLDNAVQMMRLCIDRLAASTFHNGDNSAGKKYRDWGHLFRSEEKLTYWLDDDNHQGGKSR